MATLPTSGYGSNALRTQGEFKVFVEDLRDKIASLLGGAVVETLTISSGSVTPSGLASILEVNAETGTEDDLDNVVPTNFEDGSVIFLIVADAADTIHCRHNQGGSGQFDNYHQVGVELDDIYHLVPFRLDGTTWREMKMFPRAFEGGWLGQEPESLTISTGSVTPSGRSNFLVITTEGGGADDLDNIVPTNFKDGDVVYVTDATDAGDVTYRNLIGGSGQLQNSGGVNHTHNSTGRITRYKYNASSDRWIEYHAHA